MTRSERLFQMTSLFIRREFSVTADELADRFGVRLRTVYRDISSLQRQGVPIEGAAGVGYMLRSEYRLPSLTFTDEEMDALQLGLRWVAAWCELRSDFRHFRSDRISDWSPAEAGFPTPHAELFESWRARENLSRSQIGV